MGDVSDLQKRIDAEFSALDAKVKRAQAEKQDEHKARQQRLLAFEKRLGELAGVWKPRLEALVTRFGDEVKATPQVTSSGRAGAFEFSSKLARIRLRFSASTDRDVRNVILDYNLEIIPVLMTYDSHERAEWPLDAVDEAAVGAWIDDRIVDFVKTYLSLHENQYYLKDHMVEDPIAGVRFPKFAAGASLEWEGKTYYFIGEETQREFKAQRKIK
jgi:YHS domain-containing protein